MPDLPKLHVPVRADEPSSTSVMLQSMCRGGIVCDAEIARKFGEILLEAHYGKEELERQRPLMVEDKEAYWRIEGSWNRDCKIEGRGAYFLSVAKYDARILDIGVWGIFHTPPDVEARIKEHLRQFPGGLPAKPVK